MKSTARHHAVSWLSSAALATALACHPALAGTYTVLHRFTGKTDGGFPKAALTLGGEGTLYGMTNFGGSPTAEDGAIFKTDTAGNVTVLHDFTGPDGRLPSNNILSLVGSTLYGGTNNGGANNDGVIFSMHTDGSHYTVLHSFNGKDGALPIGALQPLRAGALVGVTQAGGPSFVGQEHYLGKGTLFSISHDGVFHELHHFTGPDGTGPNALLKDAAGMLYGSTNVGGSCASSQGCGLVFSFDPATRTLTTLYTFTGGADGSTPILGSVGPDGTLYGAATLGKTGNGLVFELTPGATGYQFSTVGTSDIAEPTTGPSLTKQGALIGVAIANYKFGSLDGGLYEYKDGRREFVETFTGDETGYYPYGQPVIDATGVVYGTTEAGGVSPCVDANGRTIGFGSCGVLYRYDPR